MNRSRRIGGPLAPRLGLLRRRAAWALLRHSGLAAAIGRRYAGIGSIFGFHHVVPDVSAHLDGELYVGTDFLAAWLASLRKAGVEPISLDDAVGRIRDPGPRPSRRRFVVVTFDDGYADVVEHALPVLERYGAPFTLYVTTDLVEGGGCLWWLGLERVIRTNDTVDVTPMGKRFAASSRREKAAALAEVSAWVEADVPRRAALLRGVFERCGVAPGAVAAEAGLSREQLRALGRHPLATIGGHTTGHPWLAALSEAEAYRETADNKAFLENVCDRAIDHFAYPHGYRAHGEREAVLAGKAGFRTAVTGRPGCLFPEHRDHLLRLPRCAVGGSRTWPGFLHAQRHGAQRFIASRGGPPVVTS